MTPIEAQEKIESLDFQFRYSEFRASLLAELKNIGFGYQPEKVLFENISLAIAPHDRIGIIGRNGQGKSTFLKILAEEITPQKGQLKYHPSHSKAYFGQTNVDRLNGELSIEEELSIQAPDLPKSWIRQTCGLMMFPGDLAEKKIKVLSGGERSRVLLGKILLQASNLLLLDEPSHHLDLEAVEGLIAALEDFEGAVVIVSHHEDLLERLVNKLIIFEDGKARVFLGGYAEFLKTGGWEEEKSWQKNAGAAKAESSGPNTKNSNKEKYFQDKEEKAQLRKQKKQFQNKLTQLESELKKLESLQTQLHQEVSEYSESGQVELLVEKSRKLSEIEKNYEHCFEELCTQSEAFELFQKNNPDLD